MFLRKHRHNNVNYYSLVENERVKGILNPVQTRVEWLGTYSEAYVALSRTQNIREVERTRFFIKLAQLEGVHVRNALPQKRYQCIVIDPPWSELDIEKIIALPIRELSDRNGCVLWLWFGGDRVVDAARCIEAWEYQIKTTLTWAKTTRKGLESRESGEWLKSSTELCLMATRGYVASFASSKRLSTESTLLTAARGQKGLKPHEFFELVEALQPECDRIQLYPKEKREGWD